MSITERVEEMYKTSGDVARTEITKTLLVVHELHPSDDSARNIVSMLEDFALEEKIESNDPVSFDDAVSRARSDVDLLFTELPDDSMRHFFSPLQVDTTSRGRPSHKEIEAQWMKRWITAREGPKPALNKWTNLIGFVGEYLVSHCPQLS
jgi:hypothetical protein